MREAPPVSLVVGHPENMTKKRFGCAIKKKEKKKGEKEARRKEKKKEYPNTKSP